MSCFEALAKAEAEVEKAAVPDVAEVETPIAHTEEAEQPPIAPVTIAPTETTAPTATGENDELPNRGDNGRGRLHPMPVKKVSTVQISTKNSDEPIATKKLILSIVSVKRMSSDISASNFDRNELEIAGELSLALGGSRQ